MNKWKPILLVLWIVGILLLLVFYIIPQEEKMQTESIKKLEQENKSLTLKNESLDYEIQQLKKDSDSLNRSIQLSNQTIQQLETQLNEKMDRINAMSAMDLHEYFSKFNADSTKFQKR